MYANMLTHLCCVRTHTKIRTLWLIAAVLCFVCACECECAGVPAIQLYSHFKTMLRARLIALFNIGMACAAASVLHYVRSWFIFAVCAQSAPRSMRQHVAADGERYVDDAYFISRSNAHKYANRQRYEMFGFLFKCNANKQMRRISGR